MDTYGDKKGEKGQTDDLTTIRIVLKSQEVKNLDFVSNKIIEQAREKGFALSGPRYMPNKILRITTRKGPNGNGTNTWDKLEMRIHTRILDIKCQPTNVSEITNFKIKPGVDINIKFYNN